MAEYGTAPLTGRTLGRKSARVTAALVAAEGDAGETFDVRLTLGLVGTSPALRRVRAEIRALGRGGFRAVLVQGESGVGKEVVTEALRLASARAHGAYEVFDCPAVPEDHLESELFGTTRGAFPGALDKAGTLERAHGGTVFFDEIAAMRREHQAKVLRVIEGKSFRRVGGSRGVTADVAVIAAAHEDLATLAAAGTFRHDLYYRLIRDGCLVIPPLRERPEDIVLLARHYLASNHDGIAPRMDPATLLLLMDYHWPGNVRQLQTALRMALRLRSDAIDSGTMREVLSRFERAPVRSLSPSSPPPTFVAEGGDPSSTLTATATSTDFHVVTARTQRQLLLDAFASASGNKTAAGILLGFHVSPGEERVDAAALSDGRRNLALRKFRYWCARLGLDDTIARARRGARIPGPLVKGSG
jgi:transcriptional regulator with PAS, ATPase and Fis domain